MGDGLTAFYRCLPAPCIQMEGRDDSPRHVCRAARCWSHGKYLDIVWSSVIIDGMKRQETKHKVGSCFDLTHVLKGRLIFRVVVWSVLYGLRTVCANTDRPRSKVLLTGPDIIGTSDWLDKWVPIALIIFLPHFLLLYGCSMVHGGDRWHLQFTHIPENTYTRRQ